MTNPKGLSPATRLLKWFKRDKPRPELEDIYDEYYCLANWLITHIPEGPEKTTAMRKLLESKDCSVRARLDIMEDAHGEKDQE